MTHSPDPTPASPESTATLLARVRGGDVSARDLMVRRYLPVLRQWASGRVPAGARSLADTDDLVQDTLIRAMDAVAHFEPRREGAFLSYLRSILLNALRDQLRKAAVRRAESLDESLADPGPSVVEEVMGRETLARYESALLDLPEQQREAVILRLEMGYSHQEIAEAVGSASANSARMLVSRALVRMAERMHELAEE